MKHSPFSSQLLIDPDTLGSEAITSVLLHADRLLLGTEKGTLLVFDADFASTTNSSPTATLVDRHEAFSGSGKASKPIDQLGVIKELNGLVCLSSGDVSLYSLADFTLLSSFSAQTRSSCSLFSLSTSHRLPPSHPTSAAQIEELLPQIHTTLALACKRRLLLLSWTDGSWNPLLEVSLPHQIRGMAFSDNGQSVFAGFSTGEYGVITMSASAEEGGKIKAELGELFQAPFPAASSSAVEGNLKGLGGKAAASLGGGLGALGGLTGLGGALGRKVEKNGVVGVPPPFRKGKEGERGGGGRDGREDGTEWLFGEEWGWGDIEVAEEVLVMRDNIALPLSSIGKSRASPASIALSRPSHLAYPSTVEETVILPPYILSVVAPTPPSLSGHSPNSSTRPGYSLAIHSLDDLALVQSLTVPPRPLSPPSSIAESTSTTSASTAPSVKPPPTPASTARLLTVPSYTAKFLSTNPPALLLTTSPPTGSIASGGGFPTQTLYIIPMSSWPDQLTSLGSSGEWSTGLNLLRRSTAPVQAAQSLPPPLLRRLASLHALDLWTRQKKYSQAVDAFIRLEVAPSRVIAVCEEGVSGRLRVEEEGWEELFGGRSGEDVRAHTEKEKEEREREMDRQREEREKEKERLRKAAEIEGSDTASVRSFVGAAGRLAGKKSWLREGSVGSTVSADDGAVAKEAQVAKSSEAADGSRKETQEKADRSRKTDELIRYLTDRRQRLLLSFSHLPPSDRPSPSSPPPPAPTSSLLSLPNVPLSDLSPEELVRTAQVVDTALFRAYLMEKAAMVGPMCRIENWCEVGEVEGLLRGKQKYRELLDLYNGKNLHAKSVELLREISADEDDLDEKLDPTVRYLQKLGKEHVEVILDASQWVFENDKRKGLEIFTADLEEVDSLPRSRVMAHLEQLGRDICIPYLEHIIHQLGETGAEFHEKLIELYLAEVAEVEEGKRRDLPTYRKLIDHLESSTSYRADRMLGRLPSEDSDLQEVRAILLGRLGRHEGALQIYVYQLEDCDTAEQYCKRVYDSDPSMRPSIFPLLLRLYLRPRQNHPLLFTPAINLLASHASRIDPVEAFELLPPLVAVKDLKTYLEKTLRRSAMQKRETKVVREVQKARLEAVEREVVELQERRVLISQGRVCPVCHKRIGSSVIAVHNPRGEVTHYQCQTQFQQMKILV